MNLHGIVRGAITTVNPDETVVISISTGYTTDATGKQIPTYDAQSISVQIQALGYRDLQQIDGLNLQGIRRKLYAYGEIDGIIRALKKGGDIITRSDGSVWKVAMQLEQFPDWCSFVITLQNQPYS